MPLELSILYRGPLSSCNYDCHYCPFAKRHETAAELSIDRQALERFEAWVDSRPDVSLQVLFTPWGEALLRRWYQAAMIRLSHQAHVRKVAIQTNLSCTLDWLDNADRERLALWCTYHPSQIARHEFLARCDELNQRKIRYSVGVVGLHESFAEIEHLRAELSPTVYLWINAFKDVPGYYSSMDMERMSAIDPLFQINNTFHPSLGRPCRGGESTISVDGDGRVQRCHFISEPLGNLYEDSLENMLRPRLCTNTTCGCHIGYVHMPELKMDEVFGTGMLERVPREVIWRVPANRNGVNSDLSNHHSIQNG